MPSVMKATPAVSIMPTAWIRLNRFGSRTSPKAPTINAAVPSNSEIPDSQLSSISIPSPLIRFGRDPGLAATITQPAGAEKFENSEGTNEIDHCIKY